MGFGQAATCSAAGAYIDRAGDGATRSIVGVRMSDLDFLRRQALEAARQQDAAASAAVRARCAMSLGFWSGVADALEADNQAAFAALTDRILPFGLRPHQGWHDVRGYPA